jgi:hypothetical protein
MAPTDRPFLSLLSRLGSSGRDAVAGAGIGMACLGGAVLLLGGWPAGDLELAAWAAIGAVAMVVAGWRRNG